MTHLGSSSLSRPFFCVAYYISTIHLRIERHSFPTDSMPTQPQGILSLAKCLFPYLVAKKLIFKITLRFFQTTGFSAALHNIYKQNLSIDNTVRITEGL